MHVTVHLLSLKRQKTDAGSVHLAHPIKRVQSGAITMLNLLWWPRSRAIIGTLQNRVEEQMHSENGFITFVTASKGIFRAEIKHMNKVSHDKCGFSFSSFFYMCIKRFQFSMV